MPSFFDASGLAVTQHFTTSDDGTRVPYFEIGATERSGPAPTVLNAYGGFEVSRVPAYMPVAGRGWLAQGGVYVVANIRGGGEYGPRWWKAALRENRPRAYEDLAAVARDLIARGVTTHGAAGVTGGSNGGLLVGNMLTRYPGAVRGDRVSRPVAGHAAVPQAARRRLVGRGVRRSRTSPEDWAFIEGFSPYHNVQAEADYPPVLFSTSTRDDRVHPGHARKMMAKMTEQGHDVLYFENIEGGHGGAADNAQVAYMNALDYTFLKQKLFNREEAHEGATRVTGQVDGGKSVFVSDETGRSRHRVLDAGGRVPPAVGLRRDAEAARPTGRSRPSMRTSRRRTASVGGSSRCHRS